MKLNRPYHTVISLALKHQAFINEDPSLNEAARNIQGFLSHHKMTVQKASRRSPASIKARIDIVRDGGKSISSGRSSVVVSIKVVLPLVDKPMA